MTGREAYEKIDNTLCLNGPSLRFNIDDEVNIDCKDADEMVECLEIIDNDLEALEIIKNKQVDMLWFNKCDTYAAYNSWMGLQRMLTEDEFNLLKERLK